MSAIYEKPTYWSMGPPPGILQTIEVDLGEDHGGVWQITQFPDKPAFEIDVWLSDGVPTAKRSVWADLKAGIDAVEEARVDDIWGQGHGRIWAIKDILDSMDRLDDHAWKFNAGPNKQGRWLWWNQEGPWDPKDIGIIGYENPNVYHYYTAPVHYEIREILDKAEEDADYEKWLVEDVEPEVAKYNLMVAESLDPEYRCGGNKFTQSTQFWRSVFNWTGELEESMGDSVDNMMSEWKKLGRDPVDIKHVRQGMLGHYLMKDRYQTRVEIVDANTGKTPLGLVHFPKKFSDYIPEKGQTLRVTYSKVSGNFLHSPKKFVAIYIH